jgi:murein DD-endopeptidase MepM/ murein hydrolase activator NlpD
MSKRRFKGAVPISLLAAFAAGALIDGWFRTYGPPRPAKSEDVRGKPATMQTTTGGAPSPVGQPPVMSGVSRTAGTSGELSHTGLRMPIDGENLESLKGGFEERRGGNRPHEAVDILAPRNTPVHAVESGTIAKLFTSKAGGLTIYQFDPGGRLCYYYAHLERYADGVKEGQGVSQGDIIGYVGTSGNAPPNTPHLHFAVFELNADKRWWQGKAIDPYLVFKDRG